VATPEYGWLFCFGKAQWYHISMRPTYQKTSPIQCMGGPDLQRGISIFCKCLVSSIIHYNASSWKYTYVGPSYSKMGPIRCIGGPQIVFQACNIAALICILLIVQLSLCIWAIVLVLQYILHIYAFLSNDIPLCRVFSTEGLALFKHGMFRRWVEALNCGFNGYRLLLNRTACRQY
jgi:hypothetical protein